MLLGSSVMPANLYIGQTYVQLGDVVRRAFVDSGMTAEQWNTGPALDREYMLVRAVYAMRAEAERLGPGVKVG